MGSSFESFEGLDSFLESFGGLDSSLESFGGLDSSLENFGGLDSFLESLKDVHLRKLFLGFVRGPNGLTSFFGFLGHLNLFNLRYFLALQNQ